MFERFTARARTVIRFAQEVSRDMGHDHIGAEHILLGLVRERGSVAARAIAALGLDPERVADRVVEIIGRGPGSPPGHIGFTHDAKKTLELSLREALMMGHKYIGTEHILLGLLREAEGVAARVLMDLGVDHEAARGAIVSLLAAERPQAVGETTWRRVPRTGARQPAAPSMTERETEVLRLFSEGNTEDEIANRLFISANTVRNHMRNIYEKVALQSKMVTPFRNTDLGSGPSQEQPLVGAACPSCTAPLSRSARYHIIDVPSEEGGNPATVLLLYCSTCGRTLDDVILPGE